MEGHAKHVGSDHLHARMLPSEPLAAQIWHNAPLDTYTAVSSRVLGGYQYAPVATTQVIKDSRFIGPNKIYNFGQYIGRHFDVRRLFG